MDGPVVTAAREALEANDIDIALPYVGSDGEAEVRRAFEAVIGVRDQGEAVRDVADLHFFETIVRVHRAGEGAPYTGLKPAGLDHGPVIPVAERAIGTGSPGELIALLTSRLEDEVRKRFDRVMDLKAQDDGSVERRRDYVEAMLDLQVWSHGVHQAIGAKAHEHQHAHARSVL